MKFRMKALWAVVMIPLTMTVTAANVEAESITENWVAESEDGAQGTDGTESDSGPYLFEWLTGEHRESLKELDLNKAKGPIEGIQPTDYVSLPDIEGQNITPPDKEAPTEEEILSRLYPYLPYNNDGTRASITGKWLAEISGDTVFNKKDAVSRLKPIAEQGTAVRQKLSVYYQALNSVMENSPGENYFIAPPDTAVQKYMDYYQKNSSAYAGKLGISESQLKEKYALHKPDMDKALEKEGKEYLGLASVSDYSIGKYGKEMTDDDYNQMAYDSLALTGVPVMVSDFDNFQKFLLRTKLRELYAEETIGEFYLNGGK